MNFQPKVINVTNSEDQTVRVQLLSNGDITCSIYKVGGDTAKFGNMKQLKVVANKFDLREQEVLDALGC